MGFSGDCRNCGESSEGNCSKCLKSWMDANDVVEICLNILDEKDNDIQKELIEKLKKIIERFEDCE